MYFVFRSVSWASGGAGGELRVPKSTIEEWFSEECAGQAVVETMKRWDPVDIDG